MNNKRKSRGGPLRTQRTRSVIAEGVYNNAHFMHSATLQIGNVVRIKTASGVVWEGVFKTFSSNFDVVLEVAAKVDNPNSPASTLLADSLVDKLIFKSHDISTMEARDVDLEYPTRDTFQTDTAISARLNGSANKEEKELEPWDPSTGLNGGENLPLELENANGWDANDMFRKNEQDYGVTSTFDQSLKGYTVPLRNVDSADYREAEAKANQIANEIENQPQYKARLELENGDEETVFAAVVRPNQQQEPNDKYIPPAKRKNQNSGKLVRSTPPPSQGSAQTTPSPKGTTAPPPINYPNHPAAAAAAVVPNNVHQIHNAANPPPPHIPPPQMNMPQHPVPNHGRPHSHTPPHGYNNQSMQRQGPPMNQPKSQINGDAKPMQQRPPRAVYPGNNPPNVAQQPYQQEQQVKAPPPPQDAMNHPRHPRDEAIKELHGFAQDFKLPPPVPPNEQPATLQGQVPIEQIPPPTQQQQQQNKPPPPPQQTTSPQQPQQSISPQQDPVEKVTNNFKKSTLNPNAKEFVLNPAAKPFQPRSPSTPSASRPHTPQTPSHSPYIPATVSGPAGQPHMPVMMPVGYMMTSQPQYQPQPQGNRIRKIPMGQMRTDVTSQMQVAAATGQPLLAPAPIQQFVYQPGINQGYPQMHALRMYDGPPQIQYLPPNPSNTPSPAQPPQYTPGQGPQPPPQQYQAAPPPQSHQFPIMCQFLHTQPHVMQNMQYLQQPPPPPQHHIPVMLPHQHPQAQQHGPAP